MVRVIVFMLSKGEEKKSFGYAVIVWRYWVSVVNTHATLKGYGMKIDHTGYTKLFSTVNLYLM